MTNFLRYILKRSPRALVVKQNAAAHKQAITAAIRSCHVMRIELRYTVRTLWPERGFLILWRHWAVAENLGRRCLVDAARGELLPNDLVQSMWNHRVQHAGIEGYIPRKLRTRDGRKIVDFVWTNPHNQRVHQLGVDKIAPMPLGHSAARMWRRATGVGRYAPRCREMTPPRQTSAPRSAPAKAYSRIGLAQLTGTNSGQSREMRALS